MRAAHQGVPVAALPGGNSGGLFSGFGNFAAAPSPTTTDAAPASRGLDGWLLDNLFGRR